MRRSVKGDLQGELSWFLIAYLTMLLGVLLGVHLLQPDVGGSGQRLAVARASGPAEGDVAGRRSSVAPAMP